MYFFDVVVIPAEFFRITTSKTQFIISGAQK